MPFKECRVTHSGYGETHLLTGRDAGKSKTGPSVHRAPVRIGLRVLSADIDDNDNSDGVRPPAEPLLQRSMDFRRTTRRGGVDGD